MEYEKSIIVGETAREILDSDLPLDDEARNAKIVYLFNVSEKANCAGQIQSPGGTWKFLSDYDYVLWVHKPTWDTLNENQRKALVYHELCHITHTAKKDGSVDFKLKKHDLEEFIDVVKNFGYWTPVLEELEKIKKGTQETDEEVDEEKVDEDVKFT